MKTENIEKTATVVNLEKRLFWYAFLVYTAMAISIVLSINGIYRMAIGNLDPMRQMGSVLFGLSAVELLALVVGLFLALSIQKAFELESEARGFTGSFSVENKIKISLIILAFMDTMIMTNGSYEAYRYAETLQIDKQKANDIRADKKVLDSFYVDLKQSEEMISAYKVNLKKVVGLSGEKLKEVLSTGSDEAMKVSIASINKLYDNKKKLYKASDAKNQNWIETVRQKALREVMNNKNLTKSSISKKDYIDNVQKMIDVETTKKTELLAQIKVVSSKMDKDSYQRADTFFLYLTALILAVVVTLFAWRMNTRRGQIKKSLETQIKTLQTRAANNVNGESDLVRLIREARERQDAEYALEDEAIKSEEEILFEKIVSVSEKANRYENGFLCKAPYQELSEEIGIHSRKHTVVMEWARKHNLIKEEGTKTFILSKQLEVA
jgi:hypothetical protein